MKIDKKISLILIALVLVFSLAACSKDNTDKEDIGNDTEQVTPDAPLAEEPMVDTTEPSDGVEEPDAYLEPDMESDLDLEPEVEADYDLVGEMIDSSDYITKIKLIKKGQDKTELKVLDSIKGNISSGDLPAIDMLELNRAYVVFLKDVDSSVVLTDEVNGVMLLEGDNHELFEKINQKVHRNN